MNVRRARRSVATFALALMAVAALGAGTAAAATVVNGDFETGNLDGWHTYSQTGDGEWFAYNKESAPFGNLLNPSGNWAAASEEGSPDTMILYQDVALEPGFSQQLTLRYSYASYAPLVTPVPDTLLIPEAGEAQFDNQQDLVDVTKADAPVTTANSSDVLATLFATSNGSPEVSEAPLQLSANLTPFAGQTVRLRIVTVANDFFNEGAVDDVKITSTPLPPAPPSNAFSKGKLTLSKATGTAKLALTVPGPGVVKAVDAKKKGKLVKEASVTATAAGTVVVPIKPTGKGTKALDANGKVGFKVNVTFTPTGGTTATQTATGTLKLTPPKR